MSTRRLRPAAATLLLASLTACSGPGINAGEQGGRAFLAFTGMLLVMAAVLWFFLSRED